MPAVLVNQPLGDAGTGLGPGQVRTVDQGILIPHVDRQLPDSAPMSLALVLDTRGTIYVSSYPGRYAVGTSAVDRLPTSWRKGS